MNNNETSVTTTPLFFIVVRWLLGSAPSKPHAPFFKQVRRNFFEKTRRALDLLLK